MNVYVCCAVLVALVCAVEAKEARNPPKVQLYSRDPGQFGKQNTLICHVSEFHPPDITIELLKDGTPLDSEQTDLAFKKNWHFHLTRSAIFTPEDGAKFTCRVTHGPKVTTYNWDPNM
ncbi:hypothetical protein WMY93_030833 [Mugilogobius chulae]|uniref:Beta-2-microglobulin n=1 Tax=Mugilogobius chulae TaxID=88201 RepID=A0AAW0ML30_9GOBI